MPENNTSEQGVLPEASEGQSGRGLKLQIGAIHTYLELYARMLVDLTPRVALVVADKADGDGNLYTGPNTEDTPAIVEATAFKSGIVVAQVDEIVDKLPRIDIPADWIDFVVRAPEPAFIEPLFTRDPAQISEIQVLMAMMAIKGIYAEYGVQSLNHGIGFDTAAIELLLPTNSPAPMMPPMEIIARCRPLRERLNWCGGST